MKVIQYTYIDVYYNMGEEKEIKKKHTQLIKRGYVLEAEDDGGGRYHYCDQFVKHKKQKQK